MSIWPAELLHEDGWKTVRLNFVMFKLKDDGVMLDFVGKNAVIGTFMMAI